MATYQDAATWAAMAPWSTTKAYVDQRVMLDMLQAFNEEHGTAWSMSASTMQHITEAEDALGIVGGWKKSFLQRRCPLWVASIICEAAAASAAATEVAG